MMLWEIRECCFARLLPTVFASRGKKKKSSYLCVFTFCASVHRSVLPLQREPRKGWLLLQAADVYCCSLLLWAYVVSCMFLWSSERLARKHNWKWVIWWKNFICKQWVCLCAENELKWKKHDQKRCGFISCKAGGCIWLLAEQQAAASGQLSWLGPLLTTNSWKHPLA